MIVLRAVQGFTGGVLIPMAFTLIITLLPKAKQPIGLALFALSATFAPAIGPTIGGYLTENWGWQYIFYVNLVPGAVMVGMLWFALEAKPMKLSLLREGDWAGIVTMAIGLSRAADRAGRRQQGRLVRLALHRQAVRHRRVALTAFIAIELTAKKPLLNLRPAGPPQFRLRRACQLPARHRALWFGVHPAGLSVADPGLQCRADRHGAGLDRAAATPADPAGAAADEALRRAHHHRHRLRAVRRLQLHEHLHDQRLRHRSAVLAEHRPRARPGAGVRAAVGGRHRRHRGGECRFGFRPVQHDAQSRRRRRHRRCCRPC